MSLKNTAYLYDACTIQDGVKRLAPARTRRLLDLGGGRGGNGVVIKQMTDAEFLCLADLNDIALDQAAAGIDATMVCDLNAEGSIETVFAKHGPFDLVLLLDVLEHVYDPWRVVTRLHAVLPKGGYLLASIPNVQNYRTILWAAMGKWRYRQNGLLDRTHVRFFDRESAQELMTFSGLTFVARDRAIGGTGRDRLVDRLGCGLLDRFTTFQYQILVRKDNDEIRDPGFCGSAGPTADRMAAAP